MPIKFLSFPKWMFVCGFIVCNILFFLSGALVGYLYCEKEMAQTVAKKEKPKRVPHKIANALIGNFVVKPGEETLSNLDQQVRTPSEQAINQAKDFENSYLK